jgi:Transcriptional regulatory protein, C terminal
VKRAGRAIELTPKEFGLLEYLMRNAGQRVRRAQIIERVWNLSFDTMFAFFVVLYSSAQIVKRKAGELAMAIQVAFQQMGAFDDSNSRVAPASTEPAPVADVQIIQNVRRLQNSGRLPTQLQGSSAGAVDHPQMDEIEQKLESALALQIDDRILSLKPSRDGVVVSLREAGFFQRGSTQLGPRRFPRWPPSSKSLVRKRWTSASKATPTMCPFTTKSSIRTGSFPRPGQRKSSNSSSPNLPSLPIASRFPVTANTIQQFRTIPLKAAPRIGALIW